MKSGMSEHTLYTRNTDRYREFDFSEITDISDALEYWLGANFNMNGADAEDTKRIAKLAKEAYDVYLSRHEWSYDETPEREAGNDGE